MGFMPGKPELDYDSIAEGNCQFCQVRCRLKIHVKGSRVSFVKSDPENHWTGGGMCPKGMSLPELVNHPKRLLHPLLRVDGGWRRIGYAEALQVIADKLAASRRNNPETWPGRVALFAPLWTTRECDLAASLFMRAAGYSNIMNPGETCISSASNILGLMLGTANSTTTVDEVPNADTVVLWGANISETLPPYSGWIERAKSRGTKVILIDCRATRTSVLGSRQIMIRPGSDGALALGVLRRVIETGGYDLEYVRDNVRGFEKLSSAVAAYTLEKTAGLTQIPPGEITAFADALSASRRTIVWLGGSLSRYANGMQTIRAIVALQGIRNRLTGPGNGIITMEGGKPEGEKEFLEKLLPGKTAEPLNMRRMQRQMAQGDVDVVLLNASYRRYPDCNAVKAALGKAGFVVCRTYFMNEEAETAHLILPGVYGFETEGSQFGAERQVFWRDRAVPPPGGKQWRTGDSTAIWACWPPRACSRTSGRPGISMPASWPPCPPGRGLALSRVSSAPSGVVWPCHAEDEPEQRGSIFREGRLMTPDGGLELNAPALGDFGWVEPKGSPAARGCRSGVSPHFHPGKEHSALAAVHDQFFRAAGAVLPGTDRLCASQDRRRVRGSGGRPGGRGHETGRTARRGPPDRRNHARDRVHGIPFLPQHAGCREQGGVHQHHRAGPLGSGFGRNSTASDAA